MVSRILDTFSDCGHLTIDNFAGIKQLDLEVKPFTILLGPQSVGKSITAKLLYFFKSIPRELSQAAASAEASSAEEHLLSHLARLLPGPTHTHGATSIVFHTKLTIRLSKGNGTNSSWKIDLPTPLKKAFGELTDSLKKAKSDEDPDDEEKYIRGRELADEAQSKFLTFVAKIFPGGAYQPRFIPAGRSFYAQIERDMAAYFESASLDPFVSDFGKLLASLKNGRTRIRLISPVTEAVKHLTGKLLSGLYERVGADDFIHAEDGRKIPSKLWSSGQQEAQPLAYILQRYCERSLTVPMQTLFIEEPEAHLFPASQKVVTELIALAFNARPKNLSVFITTHSPYILTTLNNLLQAGQIYSKKSKLRTKLKKVIPEDRAINPEWLGAYYMDREECRSIIDADTGLINGAKIDDVSARIAEDFDALLEISR